MAVQSAYVSATTTPTTVSFTGSGSWITVKSLNGAGIVTARADGTAAGAADENFYVAAAAGDSVTFPCPASKSISVYAASATTVGVMLS